MIAPFEENLGFLTALDRLLERLILLHHFLHLFLDLRKIFRREAVALNVEIVIKAFVGRRTNIQQSIRPETRDGRRHDMRAGMTNPLQLGHPIALIERLALSRSLLVLHTKLSPIGTSPGNKKASNNYIEALASTHICERAKKSSWFAAQPLPSAGSLVAARPFANRNCVLN